MLTRGEKVIVFKNVSAEICQNCGHYYLSEAVSMQLYQLAEEALSRGAELEVYRLQAA
jgi:hypothetical protein